MKILLVNLYPSGTIARYQLASYVLKAYVDKYSPGRFNISVLNMPVSTSKERLLQKIVALSPALVGYSCYSWNMALVGSGTR